MTDTTSQAFRTIRKNEVGYTGLSQVNGRIYEEIRNELTYPNNIITYKKMAADPIIKSANNILDIMISRVEWNFKTNQDSSQESKDAAEYLNWCMKNLSDGHTWKSTIEEISSYRIYGFHIAEKIYERVKKGKYSGKYKWKKLATRSQDTVDKWLYSDDGRNLLGIEQNLSYILHRTKGKQVGSVEIPKNKFLHFRYGTRRDNPEGDSPLKGCYIPWKYKTLIEEYEAVGIAKDLGGVPVIGIDVEMLSKAQQDPNGPEASIVSQLHQSAASLHAGDKTFITVPVAYTDTGKELFTFDLVGINGGGKQYNTNDIIQRKQNEIFWIYLADVLKLGTDSHGSFALADSKNVLLAFAIDHHLQLISDVINKDLVPQTLALNGIYLDEEDMPFISYGDLDEVDLDNFSKLIQRIASTGYLPKTKEIINEILDKAGFDFRIDSNTSEEDFINMFPDSKSRSGDGMKTPFEGTSEGGGETTDSSIANTENA